MSATLKRRLERLEQAAGKGKRTRGATTLVVPAADADEGQWQQFAARKAEAEASAETIVVIRSCQLARAIDYRGRVVIVPPKLLAAVEVRPLPMEGSSHAH